MADELDAVKPKRGRPPKRPLTPDEEAVIAEVAQEEFDATREAKAPKIPRPRIAVFDRGLQTPFGIPSSPVDLKESGLVTHWMNTELKGGTQATYYDKHEWLKVRPEYVKHLDRLQYTLSPDGYVTRGERHKEILMYTTVENWRNIQLAKQRENERLMQPGVEKRDLVEAAAKTLGPEAAEYLHDHVGPVGDVRTNYERIEKREE